MKKNLLPLLVMMIFAGITFKSFAQRDSGGYSVGNEVKKEQSITSYPNSFTAYTTIKYNVPSTGRVVLKIYNFAGQLVANLVDAESVPGEYSLEYNASNLSSGIYICRYSFISDEKTSVMTRNLSIIK